MTNESRAPGTPQEDSNQTYFAEDVVAQTVAGSFEQRMDEIEKEYGSELSPEFHALAPQYYAILERLSDDPVLKHVYWSMGRHFDGPEEQQAFEQLMEVDDDAFRWGGELSRYESEQEKAEHEKRRLEVRSDIPLGDLVEKTSSDGKTSLKFSPRAANILARVFRPAHFIDLYQYRDHTGNTKRAAITVGLGSGRRMVTIDEDERLALGDEFSDIWFNPKVNAYIGRIGARNYLLDGMGRNELARDWDKEQPKIQPIQLDEIEKQPEPDSRLDKTIQQILES